MIEILKSFHIFNDFLYTNKIFSEQYFHSDVYLEIFKLCVLSVWQYVPNVKHKMFYCSYALCLLLVNNRNEQLCMKFDVKFKACETYLVSNIPGFQFELFE